MKKTDRVKTSQRNRMWWIILVTFVVYLVLDALITSITVPEWLNEHFDIAPAVYFVLEEYTITISAVILLFILCMVVKKNRPIWNTFTHRDPANTPKTLLLGLGLGFLTNVICIAASWIHGDIKLYFEMAPSMIPVLLFAFVSTFIQSSSEEMWCRGFMYARLKVHYPLWAAIVVNGSIFGLMHIFNDGVSVLAIMDLVLCGISYSLLRWYTGSMWCVMGIHTMWNFTQNFIFGLPNSGLVSQVSAFHLDASNGITNLIYDPVFGVEGGLPAVIVDSLLGIIILLAAKRDGRLGELLCSDEMRDAGILR